MKPGVDVRTRDIPFRSESNLVGAMKHLLASALTGYRPGSSRGDIGASSLANAQSSGEDGVGSSQWDSSSGGNIAELEGIGKEVPWKFTVILEGPRSVYDEVFV
jgi:hypothetical protein